jgi:outer membrane immunogenic protein
MRSAYLGILLCSITLPAAAADLLAEPQPVAPSAFSDAAYNWTGAYGGIEGGMNVMRGSFVINGSPHHTSMQDRFIGAFAGYQYEFSNNVVLGLEADVRRSFGKTQYNGFGVGSEMWTDWSGTIRARVGYAFDRTLVYATGGWAAQRGWVDSTVTGLDNDTNTGYVLGAGLEYAFTDRLFGRLEYQFTDYRKKRVSIWTTSDTSSHTVMLGIGTRF